MKDSTADSVLVLFVMVAGVLLLWFCWHLGEKAGYKKGQLDAYRGIIKYELIEDKDGSREWIKIKEEGNE